MGWTIYFLLMTICLVLIHNTVELRLTYTPFTQGLRRQNGCLGRSRVVHRTFRHRHGRHEVLSMFKTVAQRSPRRSVAHRSLKGGRHTHRRGRRMDARWSAIGRPVNKCVLLWTLCINLSDASAFLVPPLCLLWPTSSVYWEIIVATTVPPFGNPWATLAMVLPPLCLLCATCYATTTALVVQGRHNGRAAAVKAPLHRAATFVPPLCDHKNG